MKEIIAQIVLLLLICMHVESFVTSNILHRVHMHPRVTRQHLFPEKCRDILKGLYELFPLYSPRAAETRVRLDEYAKAQMEAGCPEDIKTIFQAATTLKKCYKDQKYLAAQAPTSPEAADLLKELSSIVADIEKDLTALLQDYDVLVVKDRNIRSLDRTHLQKLNADEEKEEEKEKTNFRIVIESDENDKTATGTSRRKERQYDKEPRTLIEQAFAEANEGESDYDDLGDSVYGEDDHGEDDNGEDDHGEDDDENEADLYGDEDEDDEYG